jgi:hypothetical protein
MNTASTAVTVATASAPVIESEANGEALALASLMDDFANPDKSGDARSYILAMIEKALNLKPSSALEIYLAASRAIELHEAEAVANY